jgi:hypothetical protein
LTKERGRLSPVEVAHHRTGEALWRNFSRFLVAAMYLTPMPRPQRAKTTSDRGYRYGHSAGTARAGASIVNDEAAAM